jgi:hypothetical protein
MKNLRFRDNVVQCMSNPLVWPKIAPLTVKKQRLCEFSNAISDETVTQITCVICACLHFKKDCTRINVGCIPNQHLLHPSNDLPSCVTRVQTTVNSSTGEVQITGNSQYLLNLEKKLFFSMQKKCVIVYPTLSKLVQSSMVCCFIGKLLISPMDSPVSAKNVIASYVLARYHYSH